MTPILAADAATWTGRALREGFFMFWETLWPLVLGFGLSGVVQAFVPRDQMERLMGDHRPKSIARATGLGTVSSSCSYAATAMAKSLFQKGADFVTAMVFMFASTNLVLELGVVLLILMGWQFAAAEFIGGPIMILLLAFTGGLVIRGGVAEAARKRLQEGKIGGAHAHQAMVGVSDERQAELETEPWSRKLRSKAAWADAAGYTMADLTMLRKELVTGYVVAGVLTVAVPTTAWNDVFLHGHGALTSIENVLVGPLIAIISFVCSVGNVPMAAALWHGGISFGGVIAFIFADLITLPLLLIYRKYYGTRLTLRLLVWFWAVMATAGLAVEGLFALVGAIPKTRPHDVVATSFALNYTTFLNIAFLLVFAYLYYLYRNRRRMGGGEGYAIDPVCGMQVQTANAPAQAVNGGQQVWFCSDHCRERFETNPTRFATPAPLVAGDSRDPVCGMAVDPAGDAPSRDFKDEHYVFCGEGCATAFDQDPARYLPVGR